MPKRIPRKPPKSSKEPDENPPGEARSSIAVPIAILSDVHANLRALEAVLEDIESLGVRVLISLGDVVGYGQQPAECVALIRATCALSILGNHDAMALTMSEANLGKLPKHIGEPLLLARDRFSPDDRDWIRNQPLHARLGSLEFCHGSLEVPGNFNYVHTREDAAKHFRATEADVSFFGHTHLPVLWRESNPPDRTPTPYEPVYDGIRLESGRQHAINVGSVGQPRDGDERPCYVIYNPTTRVLIFRRIS